MLVFAQIAFVIAMGFGGLFLSGWTYQRLSLDPMQMLGMIGTFGFAGGALLGAYIILMIWG